MRKTGIVVPCYNEAARLPVSAFEAFLAAQPDFCLCFVNDGSADDTAGVLRTMARARPQQIAVVDQTVNRGKAEAVRTGVQAMLADAAVEQVGYLDADLSTPLEEYRRLAELLAASDRLQAVCGSRIRRMGARVERSAARHYVGRVVATLISYLLQLPFYDTQCGAKVFSRQLAEPLFAEEFSSKWLFDVELMFRIKARHPAEINDILLECPLETWVEVRDSKISWADAVRVPLELWRIASRYRT